MSELLILINEIEGKLRNTVHSVEEFNEARPVFESLDLLRIKLSVNHETARGALNILRTIMG